MADTATDSSSDFANLLVSDVFARLGIEDPESAVSDFANMLAERLLSIIERKESKAPITQKPTEQKESKEEKEDVSGSSISSKFNSKVEETIVKHIPSIASDITKLTTMVGEALKAKKPAGKEESKGNFLEAFTFENFFKKFPPSFASQFKTLTSSFDLKTFFVTGPKKMLDDLDKMFAQMKEGGKPDFSKLKLSFESIKDSLSVTFKNVQEEFQKKIKNINIKDSLRNTVESIQGEIKQKVKDLKLDKPFNDLSTWIQNKISKIDLKTIKENFEKNLNIKGISESLQGKFKALKDSIPSFENLKERVRLVRDNITTRFQPKPN